METLEATFSTTEGASKSGNARKGVEVSLFFIVSNIFFIPFVPANLLQPDAVAYNEADSSANNLIKRG